MTCGCKGFDPDYTVADNGSGLRAGQKAAMPETPCHGDVFQIQQQFEQVANGLARQAQETTTHRIKLEQTIAKALLTNSMTRQLTIQHAIFLKPLLLHQVSVARTGG